MPDPLCLHLDRLPGGLTPSELMLVSRHLAANKPSYREVRLVVQYCSSQERVAAATVTGLVMVLRTLRQCPALERLSIRFMLDEEELRQEMGLSSVPGIAAHAWQRYFAV